MFKKIFGDHAHNIGVLILRIAVGTIFVWHGWLKLSDMAMTVKFFGMIGYPGYVAYAVMLSELLGGIAILLGAWVAYSTIPIIVVMISAIVITGVHRGVYWGHELELVLLAAAFAIACIGAGKYSLDRLMKKN